MNQGAKQLPADFHTHTVLCQHAGGEPIDYARAARKAGLAGLATTDHAPNAHQFDPENRMTMEQLDQYLGWFRNPDDAGIPHLVGLEADYYSGCFGDHLILLEKYPFDVIIGAVHYQNYWATEPEERGLYDKEDIFWVWQRYFKMIGLMAETGKYDVVAHLDLPKKHGRIPPDKQLREIVLPTLDRISRAGMSIEINTGGLRDPIREMYPSPQILQWAKEREIPIVFGSNAHKPDEVGFAFDQAVEFARKAGYTQYAWYEKRERSFRDL